MKTVTGATIAGEKIDINIDELKFRPSIYAVIVKDGKILMTNFPEYGYYFIGGGIDLGEDHKVALIREVKEEAGLAIKVNDLLDVQTYFFQGPIRKNFTQTIAILYNCEIVSDDVSEIELEESEKTLGIKPEWIDLKSLKTIRIAGGREKFVEEIIDKILKLYE